MRLSNFLADGDHDPLPADHRSDAQTQRDHELHPDGNELGHSVELLFVVAQLFGVAGGGERLVGFRQFADRFSNQVTFGTQVFPLSVGELVEGRRVPNDLRDRSILVRESNESGLRRLRAVFQEIGARRLRVLRGNRGARTGLGIKNRLHGFIIGDEPCHAGGRHRGIDRVDARQDSDQDQHDEAHAFLAVVGSVREADAGTGEHEQQPDPPDRRLRPFGRFVELLLADDRLHQEQQQRRANEADDR